MGKDMGMGECMDEGGYSCNVYMPRIDSAVRPHVTSAAIFSDHHPQSLVNLVANSFTSRTAGGAPPVSIRSMINGPHHSSAHPPGYPRTSD